MWFILTNEKENNHFQSDLEQIDFTMSFIWMFYSASRFMGKMSGHLGIVNKVLESLAAQLERIQCIDTVKASNLEWQIFPSSRLIRFWGNLVESGLDICMICYQKIVIISVMNSVTDLACQSFLVFSLSVFQLIISLSLTHWHAHIEIPFTWEWVECGGVKS